MRPVQLADIEATTQVLLALPVDERETTMRQISGQARLADTYRKRLNKPHPEFGTGTLMSAASRFSTIPRAGGYSAEDLECLLIVINELLRSRW